MQAVQVQAQVGALDDDGVEALFAELEPVQGDWLRDLWSPYLAKSTPPRSVTLRIAVLPGAPPAVYELQEDGSLFQQLASLYALWGWPALDEVRTQLHALSPARPELLTLVNSTLLLLRGRIAQELAAIESEVGVLAMTRWRATAKQVQAWKGEYRSLINSQYVFVRREAWVAANKHLAEFHALQDARRHSEEVRRSSPGLGRDYVPGVNDALYRYVDIARTWGIQEKAYARDAAKALGQLHRICPAAVMVADLTAKLFDPRSSPSDEPATVQGAKLQYSYRESALATTIMDMLQRTSTELASLVRSLGKDGVAEQASKPGGLARASGEDWNIPGLAAERIVARRSLERWSLASVVRRSLTTPVGLLDAVAGYVMQADVNAVLGMTDLVRAYAIDPKATRRSSFRTCVATHYLHALEAEVDAVKREAERFEQLITVINWIASVTAVVAFIASTVVSGGATLPTGIAAACAIIEGADAVLGVAVLALMLVDVAVQVGTAQEEYRQAISLLSVHSADTIRSVGTTLATCQLLGIGITTQVVEMLVLQKTAKLMDALSIRIGVSNRIRVTQRALELEWLADDIGAVVEDGVLVFNAWGRAS